MRKVIFALLLLGCAPHIPERARIEAITSSAGVLSEEPNVDRLAWLAGCWEARAGTATIEEYWSNPRGGSMIGVSRTIRGDSTLTHELMLVRSANGRIAFEALPDGQSLTMFVLVSLSDSSVAFENPTHDFPQRVRYRRTATDSLLAQVDGTVNGRERVVTFPYARVRCPNG